MDIKITECNGIKIATVYSSEILINDEQSALDFIASVGYETGCEHVAINKEAIADDFFILSTKIAGNILQKFINYNMKLAVIGDFSVYTSKPLRDFIYESNCGNNIFFVPTEREAIEKLSATV